MLPCVKINLKGSVISREIKMEYLLVAISMLSMVLQNSLFNTEGKRTLKTREDRFFFNAAMYTVCILLFAALAIIVGKFSWFTLVIGLVFGFVTSLSNFSKLTALSKGPMHITVLITSSSMIISALSGALFFNESFSVGKAIATVMLLCFIYISLGRSGNTEIKKGWGIICIVTFLLQGIIGILQKVHQTSQYKDEIFLFLASAFMFSFAFSAILSGGIKKERVFGKRQYIFAVVCGLCTFLMNFLNLKLSGILPSQIFFPLVNGGAIVITSIVSVFFFKEKLTKTQLVGLVGGFCSLILICLL